MTHKLFASTYCEARACKYAAQNSNSRYNLGRSRATNPVVPASRNGTKPAWYTYDMVMLVSSSRIGAIVVASTVQ
eukprot:3344583-Pleurochrysis_carterae.AAC.1